MTAVDAAYQNNFAAVKDLLGSYKTHTESVPTAYKFQNFVETRSVDQRDPFGDTILHAAAANGNLLLVRFLVGEGADVNAVNHAGSTPLHKACSGLAPETALAVVKFLLGSGANPLIRNKLGLLAEDYARFDAPLATALMGEFTDNIEVVVPKALHGYVIGSNGAVREELQLETHTTILIPSARPESGEVIRVIGRKEHLEPAKARILKLTAESKEKVAAKEAQRQQYQQSITPKAEPLGRGGNRGAKAAEPSAPAPVSVKYPLAFEKHGALIGPGGRKIHGIRQASGAKITIPQASERENSILVEGTAEQVDKALALLKAALSEAFPTQATSTVGFVKSSQEMPRLPVGGQPAHLGGGAKKGGYPPGGAKRTGGGGGGAKHTGGGAKHGGGGGGGGQRKPPLGSAAAE